MIIFIFFYTLGQASNKREFSLTRQTVASPCQELRARSIPFGDRQKNIKTKKKTHHGSKYSWQNEKALIRTLFSSTAVSLFDFFRFYAASARAEKPRMKSKSTPLPRLQQSLGEHTSTCQETRKQTGLFLYSLVTSPRAKQHWFRFMSPDPDVPVFHYCTHVYLQKQTGLYSSCRWWGKPPDATSLQSGLLRVLSLHCLSVLPCRQYHIQQKLLPQGTNSYPTWLSRSYMHTRTRTMCTAEQTRRPELVWLHYGARLCLAEQATTGLVQFSKHNQRTRQLQLQRR